MADHPLQVAADKHVLRMADVVLDSVGAARDALDLNALETALTQRDGARAEDIAALAVDAADAVLRGQTGRKSAKADTPAVVEDVAGLEAVIREALDAGGTAVELCVVPRLPSEDN